jgi:hypothetical protein
MKIYILSTLLFFSLSTVFSQSSIKTFSESQIKMAICHKWKLTYLEGKGKKVTIPNNGPVLILGFNADGKLFESDGKNNYNGTWTYNHSTFTITTTDKDGEEKHIILDVTGTQLIMKSKFKGIPFNMGLQKID